MLIQAAGELSLAWRLLLLLIIVFDMSKFSLLNGINIMATSVLEKIYGISGFKPISLAVYKMAPEPVLTCCNRL